MHALNAEGKGLLAFYLDTTIPAGCKIHLCHACNNEKCSNPEHLYWGTASENASDRIETGGPSAWDSLVKKYGYEEACAMQKQRNHSKAGKGNAGKLKSEAHKEAIRQAILRRNA